MSIDSNINYTVWKIITQVTNNMEIELKKILDKKQKNSYPQRYKMRQQTASLVKNSKHNPYIMLRTFLTLRNNYFILRLLHPHLYLFTNYYNPSNLHRLPSQLLCPHELPIQLRTVRGAYRLLQILYQHSSCICQLLF